MSWVCQQVCWLLKQHVRPLQAQPQQALRWQRQLLSDIPGQAGATEYAPLLVLASQCRWSWFRWLDLAVFAWRRACRAVRRVICPRSFTTTKPCMHCRQSGHAVMHPLRCSCAIERLGRHATLQALKCRSVQHAEHCIHHWLHKSAVPRPCTSY